MAPKSNLRTRHMKQQALSLLHQNRLPEAKALYLEVSRIDQDDPDNWAMLGVVMARSGEMQAAASCFGKAIALRPGFAEAHYNLGKACKEAGDLEAAVASYEAALRLRPDWQDAWFNLGIVLDLLGRLREAERCYRQVLSIDPGYSRAHKALGNVLISLGDLDGSAECFASLERAVPGSVDARIGHAKVLERRGEVAEAAAMARQVIEAGPRNLEADLLYASLCGPEEAIARLQPWLADQGHRIERRSLVTVHFTLGDLHDRLGKYAPAFEHYQAAHRLKARQYDLAAFSSLVGDMISVFSPESMSAAPRATHGSVRPIFIVGMPRSGTTLVEQILSSHPDVFGAGELEEIRHITLEMLGVDGSGRIQAGGLRDLTTETCNQFAARYLANVDGLAQGQARVTDKMPQNFIGLGVIALLFPGAAIIHCRRNPVDTCLSCFTTDFGATHDYANDLSTLGGYYREYRRMMRHWKGVLEIPMLEVDYEALVADQEATTRALLEYCGLDWNDQCLRFFDSGRSVATSSYDQVRQPIYSRSVGKWKKYAAWLAPLIDALGAD
jgi:tetratricopeptide (TPR) repeat protein